jgi:pimeloyl-ACP methyl ester carboxylesterase
MKIKTANLENRKIAYFDEGKGENIVLIHGFCGSHEYWEEVIPELAKEYRVIAPDLSGHGKSSVGDPVCAVEDLSEDIKDLIGHLGLDQVTMLGHSLGGYITLAFADHQSNRLKGYGLIHSTAFPDDEAGRKKRDSTIEEVREKGIKSVIDQMVPNLFAPDTLLTEKMEKAKRIGYETAPDGAIAAAIAMKNRPNRNDVLQNSNIPVLLVAGESDQVIPPAKTFSVSKANISQATLQRAGHMGMYEAKDALIEEITAFMTKIK